MQNAQSRVLYEAYCLKHCTRKELLNLVCLSQGCQQVGLLCRLCCIDRHQGHDTVTTTQLAEDIDSLRFDKSLKTTTENAITAIKGIKVKTTSFIKQTKV